MVEIIKLVQKRAFDKELCSLKLGIEASTSVHESHQHASNAVRTSPLARLDPFIDEQGITRVGGRFRRSTMDSNNKHPVVFPKKTHILKLIARHFHEKVNHQNEIRASGYWILGCKDVVAKLIKACIIYQRLHASANDKKMERGTEGVLFTCLASRAIYLEVSHTLETDSFLNAFRRFICR